MRSRGGAAAARCWRVGARVGHGASTVAALVRCVPAARSARVLVARRLVRFHNRTDAGRRLAQALVRYRADHPWIVALPRGGVPVAREVARALEAPMEVFVVRKLGAPFQPEYGLGAVAEDGTLWVDPRAAEYGVRGGALDAIVARERVEIARRVARYRGARPFPDVRGAAVILVDDGIATGGTARVAVRALRAMGVARLVLAAPVAAAETLDALRPEVDDIVCLETPVDLGAVALWYRDFDQVPDEEVLAGLVACDRERRGASRRIDG